MPRLTAVISGYVSSSSCIGALPPYGSTFFAGVWLAQESRIAAPAEGIVKYRGDPLRNSGDDDEGEATP